MERTALSQLGLPLCEPFPSSPRPKQSGSSAIATPPAREPAATTSAASAVDGAPVLGPKASALLQDMLRPLPLRCPKHELSIISFNMLLKGFDAKWYYPEVPAKLRAWAWRKKQLIDLMAAMDADVWCMQEVEVSTFAEEFSFLPDAGYGWVEPKDDSKGKYPDLSKCAIFFKKEKFEKVWQDQRSRIVLAALRHRASDRMLYVASCHLEGAPSEAATRFTQTRKALDSVRKQMMKDQKQRGVEPATCALVFAGDFNEGQDGAVCHCLRTGGLNTSFRAPQLPYEELTKADYSHEFELTDLYGDDAVASRPPTFRAPGSPFVAIDFVFFSHASLQPVALRRPFTDAQLEAAASGGIPSQWHFSDHVPVGGVFKFASPDDTDATMPNHVEVL